MLKRVAIALLVPVVAGAIVASQSAGQGWRLVRSGLDRSILLMSGTDPQTRCWDRVQGSDGHVENRFVGSRNCYRFEPARLFSGIYVDEFEGQRFLEGAHGPPPYQPRDRIWLELDDGLRAELRRRLPPDQRGRTRIWQIEILGRKAIGRGGFGHLGGSDGLIVVDAVRSAGLVATLDGYLAHPARR